MEYKRIGFIFSILLLILLSACQLGTPTPTPLAKNVNPGPEAGIVANNPGNPGPGSLLPPACNPPVPSVGNIISFCANPSAKLGGATAEDYTSLTADGTNSWLVGDFISSAFTCTLSDATSEAICSGPQNGTVQVMVCSSCGGDTAASNAPHVCAKGYTEHGDGNCYAANASQNDPSSWCPQGSHYNNTLQNCADNNTNHLASPCPSGYSYYIPYAHECFSNSGEH